MKTLGAFELMSASRNLNMTMFKITMGLLKIPRDLFKFRMGLFKLTAGFLLLTKVSVNLEGGFVILKVRWEC